MTAAAQTMPLTAALEDYLETIFELIQDRMVARVKDIAKARQVKPGSVTPALKRLQELGLIHYEQREFIRLTPEGEREARRVLSRHRILVDFLTQVLDLEPAGADADACAMEHHLSDQTMDRLVRLFEFMQTCPNHMPPFLQEFHHQLRDPQGPPSESCTHCEQRRQCGQAEDRAIPLTALPPGQQASVRQINAQGAVRQRLLDMGLLPGAPIRVERSAPSGSPIWITLHTYQLSLRKQEAAEILVEAR
jgi:DtxR family transcriptional regulator, Mn-dependent transcriptional regulator